MNKNDSIITKVKSYRIPYKEINNTITIDYLPTWKEEYNNDIGEINVRVANNLLYRIAYDLFGGVNEVQFVNESKNPVNHFQMNMYLGDYILSTNPFIYVDNKHKIIPNRTKLVILNSDYEDVVILKETNSLKGGKADNLSISDIAKKFHIAISNITLELNKGIEIETEHTKDKEKAREIAMDHLSEIPDYYTRLSNMEKKAESDQLKETKPLIKSLLRENLNNRREYLSWKRKNVTLRGISDTPDEEGFNGGGAMFGNGLYTAFLSNKKLAKNYGKVYFVVNAIPKKPKVVNSFNDAEIFTQTIINNWCKERNLPYQPHAFYKETNLKDEMIRLGYDGLIIKGREMVNYTPSNILYFSNEEQLYNYFVTH